MPGGIDSKAFTDLRISDIERRLEDIERILEERKEIVREITKKNNDNNQSTI